MGGHYAASSEVGGVGGVPFLPLRPTARLAAKGVALGLRTRPARLGKAGETNHASLLAPFWGVS